MPIKLYIYIKFIHTHTHTHVNKLGFPGGSVLKNQPANVGDADSIPGSGRSS